MRSMTGFGRGSARADEWEITVQVSSVNRKTFEVALSAPREWQVFEPEITAAVREKASRGRVQVTIDTRGPASAGIGWDEAVVETVVRRLETMAAKHGVHFSVTPDLLFQIAQTSRADRATLEPAKAWSLIRGALEPALAEFGAAREREGAALARDFAQRAAVLAALVERIAARTTGTVQNYRENLLSRLRQAGLDLDLNDERVLKEISLFADRVDVSEELTRLRSHLEQLARMLTGADAVGRKMEFQLQEIGREIHTIGSKANDLEISRAVIDFKNELERIREQAQNVE